MLNNTTYDITARVCTLVLPERLFNSIGPHTPRKETTIVYIQLTRTHLRTFVKLLVGRNPLSSPPVSPLKDKRRTYPLLQTRLRLRRPVWHGILHQTLGCRPVWRGNNPPTGLTILSLVDNQKHLSRLWSECRLSPIT